MKPIYLTDKDFESVDIKLDSLESDIDHILSTFPIDEARLEAHLSQLEDIKTKLQNTMEFAGSLRPKLKLAK